METPVQRSQRQQKYQDAMCTLLPPRVTRNHWFWHSLWKKCKNTTAFTTNFPQNIDTRTRKTIAEKQIGKNSTWVPIRPRKSLKTQEQPTRDF